MNIICKIEAMCVYQNNILQVGIFMVNKQYSKYFLILIEILKNLKNLNLIKLFMKNLKK